jgi:inosine/xanthosine triphosphate pyrophosphatase family protein
MERIGRPGAIGSRKPEVLRNYDAVYGQGNWRLAHAINGRSIPSHAALQLYENAYFEYFRQHPDELEYIASNFSEVYDNNISNIQSGLDYSIQEFGGNHYQDIAIRNCLVRNGMWFSGKHPLEVRMKGEGKRWGPGVIPFHLPQYIVKPEIPGWWGSGSLESWYQSNKFLEAASDPYAGAGLCFATSNKGKVESAQRGLGRKLTQVTLDINEDLDDVEKIAKHKAQVAYSVLCKPVICDDSGFEIPHENGWPGHHVKRELEARGLEHFREIARRNGGAVDAAFIMTLSYMDERLAAPQLFTSRVWGTLVDEPRGHVHKPFVKSELALCFIPEGSAKTIAEMTEDEYRLHATTGRWKELAGFLRSR